MKRHAFMLGHDGYAPHSHEVRADHEGVERLMTGIGGGSGTTAWGGLIAFIKPLCRSMTAEGIPPEKQLGVLLGLGIKVGDGGRGGAGSRLDSECTYCHQTGNGGHGGFCPNGNW